MAHYLNGLRPAISKPVSQCGTVEQTGSLVMAAPEGKHVQAAEENDPG